MNMVTPQNDNFTWRLKGPDDDGYSWLIWDDGELEGVYNITDFAAVRGPLRQVPDQQEILRYVTAKFSDVVTPEQAAEIAEGIAEHLLAARSDQ